MDYDYIARNCAMTRSHAQLGAEFYNQRHNKSSPSILCSSKAFKGQSDFAFLPELSKMVPS